MLRAFAFGLAVLVLSAGLPLGSTQTTVSTRPVVIAVIDSGIRATHHAFASGQIVAWYDFSNHTPRSNQTAWDPVVGTPYDSGGHGTAVASMAAGVDGIGLTPNFAPGTALAIANIFSCDTSSLSALGCGFLWRDFSDAIRWAVDVAHADVISLSIGASVPQTGLSPDELEVLDSLNYAHDKGVLVVEAAGNGVAGIGLVPDESWTQFPDLAPHLLEVGGARSGAQACYGGFNRYVCDPGTPFEGYPPHALSHDPIVTADYDPVAACVTNDTCVAQQFGTSFSSPKAASLVAHLLAHARGLGLDVTAADMLPIVKAAALPHVAYGPATEGYGYLDPDAAARGDAILDGAAVAHEPDWDARVAYVEGVRERERGTWCWYQTGSLVTQRQDSCGTDLGAGLPA